MSDDGVSEQVLHGLPFDQLCPSDQKMLRALDAINRADVAAAIPLLQELMADDYAPAHTVWGSFLEHGNGMPRDLTAARRQFLIAAELGNVNAMLQLGIWARDGREGWPPDKAEELRWFRTASATGDRRGHFELGITLIDDAPREARRLLRNADRDGHLEAGVWLAWCWFSGIGGLRRRRAALRKLRGLESLAAQGNSEAQQLVDHYRVDPTEATLSLTPDEHETAQ